MNGETPASEDQIRRLQDAIDHRFGTDWQSDPAVDHRNVLKAVRDAAGRDDIRFWDDLSSGEIEQATAAVGRLGARL